MSTPRERLAILSSHVTPKGGGGNHQLHHTHAVGGSGIVVYMNCGLGFGLYCVLCLCVVAQEGGEPKALVVQ